MVGHPAALYMAQRAVQILAFSQWPMRVHAAGWLAAEPFLPLRQKDVLQIPVRFRQALCASLPQAFHQPVLQRCKTALYPPLGLRRVRVYQLDAQLPQRPPDLAFPFLGPFLAVPLAPWVHAEQPRPCPCRTPTAGRFAASNFVALSYAPPWSLRPRTERTVRCGHHRSSQSV